MTELLTFHGDPSIKAKYLEQIIAHEKADEIVKGKYWENGKGCAVGCIIHGGDHAKFEPLFGIPEWMARLIDTLFEGLPNEDAKKFPRRFWEAIPENKNLESVKWKFCSFILKENIKGVLSLDIEEGLKKKVGAAIRNVLAVHTEAIKTGKWSESAARSAGSAAESAAWSAGSARSAAESAAWSAGSAALSARSAGSAAWSAGSAAESAAYNRYADELIRIMEEMK